MGLAAYNSDKYGQEAYKVYAETLETNENDSHNETLDVSAYPAGIYNVTIRINDSIVTEKFVKF